MGLNHFDQMWVLPLLPLLQKPSSRRESVPFPLTKKRPLLRVSHNYTPGVFIQQQRSRTGVIEMGMGDTDVFECVLRTGEDAFDGSENLSCMGWGAGVDHYPFVGLGLVWDGGRGRKDGVSADEEGGNGESDGTEGEDECAMEESMAQFYKPVLLWDQLG